MAEDKTKAKDDPPSKALDDRLNALTEEIDHLEKEAFPPKPKVPPVGGMI